MKPQFLRVGSIILNLANVEYMEVKGPNLVVAYMGSTERLEFIEDEAKALLVFLEAECMTHIEVPAGEVAPIVPSVSAADARAAREATSIVDIGRQSR